MDVLKKCFGQHGWKEFYRNRRNILAEFDKILEQTVGRPVQVAHGAGVEAYIRKWFSEFLPKKYGVTSGYIIPTLYEDNFKIYHFDIIIYNQLDAPVLWTEGNEDQSEQGKSRAIPAKSVVKVFEVKSRLTKSNVTDALVKLNQTKSFIEQLNTLYSCGVIFIDLKESDNNRKSIIKELLTGKDVYGFSGGVVLRYEGDDTSTGIIRFFNEKQIMDVAGESCIPLAKPIEDLDIYAQEDGNILVAEKNCGVILVKTGLDNWSISKTYGVMFREENKSVYLEWSRTNFSTFCTDLLGTLEGLPYNHENRPSFGRIFDSIERKNAQPQSHEPEIGKPFLELKLNEGRELGEKLTINQDGSSGMIDFQVIVKNIGDIGAIVSDDTFKSQCELNPGNSAIRPVSYEMKLEDSNETLGELIKEKGLEFTYRLVFYPVNTDKVFYSIEKKVSITEGGDIKLS